MRLWIVVAGPAGGYQLAWLERERRTQTMVMDLRYIYDTYEHARGIADVYNDQKKPPPYHSGVRRAEHKS